MKYPLAAVLIPMLFVAVNVRSSADDHPVRNWKGYVTDTWCGVNRDTKAPTVECTRECVQSKSAKYAFYNFGDGKVYILNPQAEAAKYAGQEVTVQGAVDGTNVHLQTMRGDREGQTITASSISPAR